jgi:glucose/arabinose dehydrogenase
VRPPIQHIRRLAALLLIGVVAIMAGNGGAQGPLPMVLDTNLAVREAASGLAQPVSFAFIGDDDMLVLEKASGKVQHVTDGTVQGTVLDLAVNSGSERGLLGIGLHPQFAVNGFVYLYWTETIGGADSTVLADVPLLGNRVDRYRWNGSTLTFDRNLIRIRALQADAGQPERGNHDGGVLRVGPDGKVYVIVGDLGRRGQLQNLRDGPFGPGIPDDQFGGPQPDNAHLSGVILRLNDDGTTPSDNPFFAAGAAIGGEVGANVQKVFAYGLRNSFGMAFDPASGTLWEQENGDDSFSELNIAEPGFNSGWVQIMGPPERIAQFRAIETDPTAPQPLTPAGYFGLQQVRWSPVNIAATPQEALARLFMLPGAHYSAPELSWKFEVAPGGIGFLSSRALGPQYRNDLFVGGARDFLEGGHLFHINLTGNRRKVGVDDPRLEDRVADNLFKWELTESESLLFGRNFGVVTDIQTGPDGNLYLVSLTHGTVYAIHRRA